VDWAALELNSDYCQPDELSIVGVRQILLRFERAVNKNQDHRSKHPDDPSK